MTKKSNKRHLRTGYTTGTCASAAAKGAAMTLLGLHPNEAEIKLPLGDTATISLCKSWTKNDTAYCTVIKDAGDDPDVTNGAEIGAQVSIIPLEKKIKSEKFPVVLKGGKGVGVVTKPGLPVRKGEAAINPVPRKMIRSAVSEAFSRGSGIVDLSNRVEVTLFVPRGEELAKKTFNPRLGILGGISILGTTGIVKPFSHQAYKETICCALQIARAVKCREVVLSTGGLSERLAKTYLPCSKEESFIQMGDYVGFSLKEALKNGFHNITVSAFMGKLSKIAAGCTYTHARNFPLDIELFISLGKRLGIKTRVLKEISHSITTRGILEILLKHRECSIIDAICTQAVEELYQMSQGKGKIFLVLFSFDNEVLWYGSKEGKIAGIK
ncbi:MAG: cobalt-precorrin-5B (C(1))-methyltransferase [Proteobacteria bacterium]|nr:cobalt-precorrin-5B (C(1))-methyltransferase [Pseudomonadota bacterium]